jgi:hypothetical protein
LHRQAIVPKDFSFLHLFLEPMKHVGIKTRLAHFSFSPIIVFNQKITEILQVFIEQFITTTITEFEVRDFTNEMESLPLFL